MKQRFSALDIRATVINFRERYAFNSPSSTQQQQLELTDRPG